MSFYNFATVIANTITQELETADRYMDRLDKQDLLIAYQGVILVLEHELCLSQKLNGREDFTDFLNEYSSTFVLKGDAQDLVGIFALNHVIRKPLLEALASRVIQIFLGAK